MATAEGKRRAAVTGTSIGEYLIGRLEVEVDARVHAAVAEVAVVAAPDEGPAFDQELSHLGEEGGHPAPRHRDVEGEGLSLEPEPLGDVMPDGPELLPAPEEDVRHPLRPIPFEDIEGEPTNKRGGEAGLDHGPYGGQVRVPAEVVDDGRLARLNDHAGNRAVGEKHVPRYLAEFEYRFNRRYDLAAMMPRLLWAGVRTTPMPYRLLRLADVYV